MIYDCHLHTEFSGDSETPVRRQIERAIQLGMMEMCITDHHDYDTSFCDTNFNLDIPSYLTVLQSLRNEYKERIRINIGVELGLQNHLKRYLHNLEKEYGSCFDFIIGSSHFVMGMDPYDSDYWETYGEEDGLEQFFKVSLSRVRNLYDTFDSFGHLDYIVRYAPHQNSCYTYQRYEQWIEPLLMELIRHGKGLECNTGGFKYGLGQPNPCNRILKRYRELGGEIITIGSDAHSPEFLGNAFEECRRILLECGFRHYAVYHERVPEFHLL